MSKPLFVRLPEEAYEKLVEQAYEEDRPVAAVMRNIICAELGVTKPPLEEEKAQMKKYQNFGEASQRESLFKKRFWRYKLLNARIKA